MLVKELGLKTESHSEQEFDDVPIQSGAHDAIAAVAEAGLKVGKEPGKFMPSSSLTRAEMAVIIDRVYRLGGSAKNQFKDVPQNHWASSAIGSLAANQVAGGYQDGTFKPSGQLTRAEFAAIMTRAIAKKNITT